MFSTHPMIDFSSDEGGGSLKHIHLLLLRFLPAVHTWPGPSFSSTGVEGGGRLQPNNNKTVLILAWRSVASSALYVQPTCCSPCWWPQLTDGGAKWPLRPPPLNIHSHSCEATGVKCLARALSIGAALGLPTLWLLDNHLHLLGHRCNHMVCMF